MSMFLTIIFTLSAWFVSCIETETEILKKSINEKTKSIHKASPDEGAKQRFGIIR